MIIIHGIDICFILIPTSMRCLLRMGLIPFGTGTMGPLSEYSSDTGPGTSGNCARSMSLEIYNTNTQLFCI